VVIPEGISREDAMKFSRVKGAMKTGKSVIIANRLGEFEENFIARQLTAY
jgi:hypothetical protein